MTNSCDTERSTTIWLIIPNTCAPTFRLPRQRTNVRTALGPIQILRAAQPVELFLLCDARSPNRNVVSIGFSFSTSGAYDVWPDYLFIEKLADRWVFATTSTVYRSSRTKRREIRRVWVSCSCFATGR